MTGATSLVMVVSYLLIWLGGAGRLWPLTVGIILLDVGSNVCTSPPRARSSVSIPERAAASTPST
jgi:hypothetical protein